jgi:hypothetical protein
MALAIVTSAQASSHNPPSPVKNTRPGRASFTARPASSRLAL